MKYCFKYIVFKSTPHLMFDRISYGFCCKRKELLSKNASQENVFVFLGCDYPNLGDYAITIAQTNLLSDLFPDKKVHVIPIAQTYGAVKTILARGKKKDLITIIGGGNMGELYYGYERKRNFIVEKLHDYKIISFPQSMIWGQNPLSFLGLKRSIKSYSKHTNLLLLAREELSFEKMKKHFTKNKVELLPDVVLTLDKRRNFVRNGIVLSFRKDQESILSKDEKDRMSVSLKNKGYKCEYLDTCDVVNLKLDEAFDRIVDSYSKAELVITDRLHGMIFAYITGTPAIVIPNNNGKIVYSYRWIESCNYIKLINKRDLQSVLEYVEQMKNVAVDDYLFNSNREHFLNLYKNVLL